MFNRFKSLILGERRFSTDSAKNRLQMVLIQDRSGISQTDMDAFKADLLEVISKYFVLETKGLNVEWQRTANATALVINTPIKGKMKVVEKSPSPDGTEKEVSAG